MIRVKVLKYVEWDKYFICFTEENSLGDYDGEFKMDSWELGMAFFLDENHTVTEEDYKSLVGREFDIERWNIKVYVHRIFDKTCPQIVPVGKEKWTHCSDEPCGRCGELCECGDYISTTDWNAEQDRLEAARKEEAHEYEERMAPIREQERIDKACNEFLITQMNKKVMSG